MTREGFTMLHYAASDGIYDKCKLLLNDDFNANVDAIDIDLVTPLILACSHGHIEVVRLLIAFGADINWRDRFTKSPLIHAYSNQQYDICDCLVEYKANINITDAWGRTILHWACAQEEIDFVKLALRNEVDINIQATGGSTALHLAALNNSLQSLCLLLERDADANILDDHGRNPIHFAALYNHIEAIKILMPYIFSMENDINVLFYFYDTSQLLLESYFFDLDRIPIFRHLIEEPSHIELLIEYGADLDLADKDGATPRQLILKLHGSEFLQECLDKRQQRIFDLSDFLLTCTDLYYAFPLAIVVAEFIHGDMPKINIHTNKRFKSEYS